MASSNKMSINNCIYAIGNILFDHVRRTIKVIREQYESIEDKIVLNEFIGYEAIKIEKKVIKELNILYQLDYKEEQKWEYFMGRVMLATEHFLISQEYFKSLARNETQVYMISCMYSFLATQFLMFHVYGKKIDYDSEDCYGITLHDKKIRLLEIRSIFELAIMNKNDDPNYFPTLKLRDIKTLLELGTFIELIKCKSSYITGYHRLQLYIYKVWKCNLKHIIEKIHINFPNEYIKNYLGLYDEFFDDGIVPLVPSKKAKSDPGFIPFLDSLKTFMSELEKKYNDLNKENIEIIKEIRLIRYFVPEIPLIEINIEKEFGNIKSIGIYNQFDKYIYAHVRGADVGEMHDPAYFNKKTLTWKYQMESNNSTAFVLKLDELFELICPFPPYDPRPIKDFFKYNYLLGISINGNPFNENIQKNAQFFGVYLYEKIRNIILKNLFVSLNNEFIDLETKTAPKEVFETKNGQYIISNGKSNYQAQSIAKQYKIKLAENKTLSYIPTNTTSEERHRATEGLRNTLKIKKRLREKGLSIDIFDKNLLIQILTKLGCKLNKKKGKGSHITFEKENYNSTLHNKNVNLPWVTKNLLPKLHIEPNEFANCLLKIKKIKT